MRAAQCIGVLPSFSLKLEEQSILWVSIKYLHYLLNLTISIFPYPEDQWRAFEPFLSEVKIFHPFLIKLSNSIKLLSLAKANPIL